MDWFISVLITIGIILAIFFIVALYVGFISDKKWAEILVLGAAFAVLASIAHSVIFG